MPIVYCGIFGVLDICVSFVSFIVVMSCVLWNTFNTQIASYICKLILRYFALNYEERSLPLTRGMCIVCASSGGRTPTFYRPKFLIYITLVM